MAITAADKHFGLSKTMKAAVNYAAANGGIIKRFPGGFWGEPNGSGSWDGVRWFGTTTIQALVSRGVFVYSSWHEGASRFPIEVKAVR